jgi:hypothetical protein
MKRPAPVHLWIIGGIAFLWNAALNLSDFLLIQIGDPAYHAYIAEVAQIPVEGVGAYYALWPWWATVGWGAAAFGATIGAILLLLRSRFAVHAFCAGLIGSIIAGVFTSNAPFPRTAGDMGMQIAVEITPYIWAVEWVIFFVFILYARHLTLRQVLE